MAIQWLSNRLLVCTAVAATWTASGGVLTAQQVTHTIEVAPTWDRELWLASDRMVADPDGSGRQIQVSSVADVAAFLKEELEAADYDALRWHYLQHGQEGPLGFVVILPRQQFHDTVPDTRGALKKGADWLFRRNPDHRVEAQRVVALFYSMDLEQSSTGPTLDELNEWYESGARGALAALGAHAPWKHRLTGFVYRHTESEPGSGELEFREDPGSGDDYPRISRLLATTFVPPPVVELFDGGQPNWESGSGSDLDAQHQSAGDFLLQTHGTLTAIEFWGSYFPSQTLSDADSFWVRIFEGAGLPQNSPIHNIPLANIERTPTDSTLRTGQDVYHYRAALPDIELSGATKYWISIVADTGSDPDDDWAWATTSGGTTAIRNIDGTPWHGGLTSSFAFTLFGRAR